MPDAPVEARKDRTDPSANVPTTAGPSGLQNKPFPSTVVPADCAHSWSGGFKYSSS
jgi:hypothetical protein